MLAASFITFAQERVISLPDGQVAGEAIARIIERGELRVGMHAVDQAPFFYRENQATKGTDVELAENIAQALGVAVRLVRTADSFDGVVNQTVFGEVDLSISKISRTRARSKRVSFSAPDATFRQAFLVIGEPCQSRKASNFWPFYTTLCSSMRCVRCLSLETSKRLQVLPRCPNGCQEMAARALELAANVERHAEREEARADEREEADPDVELGRVQAGEDVPHKQLHLGPWGGQWGGSHGWGVNGLAPRARLGFAPLRRLLVQLALAHLG